MRILDIDMDYFLDSIPDSIPSYCKERVNGNDYVPWCKNEVISFLENNLGLSKNNKIKGKIITHHHEALYYWKYLIGKKKLNIPFEVIHVDSHADLGLGFPKNWRFVSEKLLKLEVEERSKIEEYKNMFDNYKLPDIGDYLVFAIAFRWISKLVYVCNPNGNGDDYLKYVMKDCKDYGDKIQLRYHKHFPKWDSDIEEYLKTSILEPEIPFKTIKNIEDVKYNGDFDFITFCISPNYTPKESDFIINIMKDYILEL